MALVAIIAITTLAHAQDKDRDKEAKGNEGRSGARLTQLGAEALVPSCYNSASGEWRIVRPWSRTGESAAVCRPPTPWDINMPGSSNAPACNTGGAFECSASEFFIQLNSRGPQGPMGAPGMPGATGATG